MMTQLTHWGQDKIVVILQKTFVKENAWISLKISLKFVSKVPPVNDIPALVQIMAWQWPGNKPLPEPMMVSLLTVTHALLDLIGLT